MVTHAALASALADLPEFDVPCDGSRPLRQSGDPARWRPSAAISRHLDSLRPTVCPALLCLDAEVEVSRPNATRSGSAWNTSSRSDRHSSLDGCSRESSCLGEITRPPHARLPLRKSGDLSGRNRQPRRVSFDAAGQRSGPRAKLRSAPSSRVRARPMGAARNRP